MYTEAPSANFWQPMWWGQAIAVLFCWLQIDLFWYVLWIRRVYLTNRYG